MPAQTAKRMREQRALAQLEKGLLALTEGDWGTAERALEKSASSHGKTTARYLAAAQAADVVIGVPNWPSVNVTATSTTGNPRGPRFKYSLMPSSTAGM